MKALSVASLLLASIVLQGCAIDTNRRAQALNGLGLLSQLDAQLDEFKAKESAAERYLLYSVTNQQIAHARLTASDKKEELAWVSAGATEHAAVVRRLSAHVDALGVLIGQEAAHEAAIAERMARVLAPLPSTKEDIAATQLKFADSAKRIPWRVQGAELKAVYDSVKDNDETNRKKIDSDHISPLK